MRQTRLVSTISIGLLFLLLQACSEAPDTDAQPNAQPDYNLSLNMTDFMMYVLEPVADSLWRSAGWVDDRFEGYYELYPTDDEGWHRVKDLSAMIVETGNAMMLPGRAYDNGSWVTYSQAMSTVGLRLMKAADEQNKEDLFQAGAQLYSVCTACHQAYNPDILSRFAPSSLSDR